MFWPFVLKLPLLVVYLSADGEIRLCALNRQNNLYAGICDRLTCFERVEMLTGLLPDVKMFLSQCDTANSLKECTLCGSLFLEGGRRKQCLCSIAPSALCFSPRVSLEPEKEICIILFPGANHLCQEAMERDFRRWKTFPVFPE